MIEGIHISTITQPTEGYASKVRSFLPSPMRLIKNINRLALPIIALFAFSSATVANAGPFAWAACIIICESAAAASSLMACVAGCGFILPIPFPP